MNETESAIWMKTIDTQKLTLTETKPPYFVYVPFDANGIMKMDEMGIGGSSAIGGHLSPSVLNREMGNRYEVLKWMKEIGIDEGLDLSRLGEDVLLKFTQMRKSGSSDLSWWGINYLNEFCYR